MHRHIVIYTHIPIYIQALTVYFTRIRKQKIGNIYSCVLLSHSPNGLSPARKAAYRPKWPNDTRAPRPLPASPSVVTAAAPRPRRVEGVVFLAKYRRRPVRNRLPATSSSSWSTWFMTAGDISRNLHGRSSPSRKYRQPLCANRLTLSSSSSARQNIP